MGVVCQYLAFSESWQHVERQVFDYLRNTTGTVDGVSAFMPWDWPRELMAPGDDFWQWSFQLSGGDTIVPNEFGQIPGGAHHAAGEIVVRGGSEAAAMRGAGMLFEAIHGAGPAQVGCIKKAYAATFPQKGRALRGVRQQDGTVKPDVIVAEVTIPVRVAFGRICIEQETVEQK